MAFSVGIDRLTGRALYDFAHVEQSIGEIFVTRIGSRVMRRPFGSAVPPLFLRKNLTPRNLSLFFAAMIMGIDLWEPRFRVVSITLPTDVSTHGTSLPTSGVNSPSSLRAGRFGPQILGVYRPLALDGDLTPETKLRTVLL